MLYNCCQLKGQGYNLREMAAFFNKFQEKEESMKRSKMHSSFSSTNTLSFSKQFKNRNINKNKRDSKGMNNLNKEIYHSHFKN